MASRVGPKGQVVIEKEIRDELGIEPGSLAIQRVVGDHVEMRFVPPSHRRSLKVILGLWAEARSAGISRIYTFDRRFPGNFVELRPG